MLEAKRWTAECDDAAVLPKAIFSSVVTSDLAMLDTFLNPEQGPGAEIGEKYNYHTARGKRNLRLNISKFLKEIEVWRSNKPDPNTGKGKLLTSIILYIIILLLSNAICRSLFLQKISKEGKLS